MDDDQPVPEPDGAFVRDVARRGAVAEPAASVGFGAIWGALAARDLLLRTECCRRPCGHYIGETHSRTVGRAVGERSIHIESDAKLLMYFDDLPTLNRFDAPLPIILRSPP